jgi:hypothetical protein
MLKLVLFVCLLVFSGATRPFRECPCTECGQNPLGPYRDLRAWKRHAEQIARGTRFRAAGIGREATAAAAAEIPAAVEQADQHLEEEIEDNPAFEMDDTEEWHYAMEMAELVANSTATVTGMEAMLKATHKRYEKHLPEGISIPTSWYMAKKLACEGKEPKWFTRDFCPDCDHLFDVDETDTECPRWTAASHESKDCNTRFDKHGTAPRQAYYFDMDDKVTRIFTSKLLSSTIFPPTDMPQPDKPMADRELVSAFDGKILQKMYYESDCKTKDETLYFACSNDGVEVEKGVSYTPITAKLLNYPTALRGLLSSIWLLG